MESSCLCRVGRVGRVDLVFLFVFFIVFSLLFAKADRPWPWRCQRQQQVTHLCRRNGKNCTTKQKANLTFTTTKLMSHRGIARNKSNTFEQFKAADGLLKCVLLTRSLHCKRLKNNHVPPPDVQYNIKPEKSNNDQIKI